MGGPDSCPEGVSPRSPTDSEAPRSPTESPPSSPIEVADGIVPVQPLSSAGGLLQPAPEPQWNKHFGKKRKAEVALKQEVKQELSDDATEVKQEVKQELPDDDDVLQAAPSPSSPTSPPSSPNFQRSTGGR